MISGRRFDVVVMRRRIRNAYARVIDGRVVIRIPERLGRMGSSRIVDELRSKISAGIMENPSRYLGMPPIEFREGQDLQIFGRRFAISVETRPGSRYARCRLEGSALMVSIPEGVQEAERSGIVSRLVTRAISKAVEGDVRAYVDAVNRRHFDSEISKVRIRANTVLWGSCSATNAISLNFRLLYAPREMLEYVVLHELAHTKVRDHSKRFWKLLGDIIPEYKERRRWLRNNAHTIEPGAHEAAWMDAHPPSGQQTHGYGAQPQH